MKQVTKKVSRKFIELTPADMAYEMYLCCSQNGWDIDHDGIETTINCDPDAIVVNEKTGSVCFELMDQAD